MSMYTYTQTYIYIYVCTAYAYAYVFSSKATPTCHARRESGEIILLTVDNDPTDYTFGCVLVTDKRQLAMPSVEADLQYNQFSSQQFRVDVWPRSRHVYSPTLHSLSCDSFPSDSP